MNYVVGFAFSEDQPFVLLILKKRPKWQRGKLNGVGGKVEPGETSIAAMVREFREETGLETTPETWALFAYMRGSDPVSGFEMSCYRATLPQSTLEEAAPGFDTTVEDHDQEVPLLSYIHGLRNLKVIPNLRWLIPMALSFDEGENCSAFEITERDTLDTAHGKT